MINPRELRIGNIIYIDDKTDNHTEEVSIINVNGVQTLNLLGNLKFDRCFPILLTEEWLVRLGFEKQRGPMPFLHSRKKGIGLNENFMQGKMIGYNLCVLNSDWQNVALIKLEYVHQLQNLYFCLTGEELIIQK